MHDHVDDTRMTWTGDTIGSAFYVAWAVEFNSPPEPEELSEDFTGLRHHRVDQWSTEISCLGVIKSIEDLLAEHPIDSNVQANSPLPADALRTLRDPATAANPLTPALVPFAQKLAGTIGFVATMARPDAYFAYCVVARHVNEQRLTKHSLKLLLRVGRYLVNTRGMALTLTARPTTAAGWDLFDIYADSSHGNAELGRSYGGFVLLSPGPTSSQVKLLIPLMRFAFCKEQTAQAKRNAFCMIMVYFSVAPIKKTKHLSAEVCQ